MTGAEWLQHGEGVLVPRHFDAVRHIGIAYKVKRVTKVLDGHFDLRRNARSAFVLLLAAQSSDRRRGLDHNSRHTCTDAHSFAEVR